LLGSEVFVREVRYAPGHVKFETIGPSRTVLKLSFVPQAIRAGAREMDVLKGLPADERVGWSFDPATGLLLIRHGAGQIDVLRSPR